MKSDIPTLIKKHNILVVDDEEDIKDVIRDSLEQAGYCVFTVKTGAEMFNCLLENEYSLIIIDLYLDGEDGLTLAKNVREGNQIPIMMLTGKGDETDLILGLEIAADDYLLKPFNIRELVARVNALIRRSVSSSLTLSKPTNTLETTHVIHHRLLFGVWILDLTSRKLHNIKGNQVYLTHGEFLLLEILAGSPNRAFSREELLERMSRDQSDSFDRTIDVQILRLRRKIEPNPKSPIYIRTERGVGYIFSHDVKRSCSE